MAMMEATILSIERVMLVERNVCPLHLQIFWGGPSYGNDGNGYYIYRKSNEQFQ